jgi:cation diffusion facilitator CzcD-associated flavoprotein CzcO
MGEAVHAQGLRYGKGERQDKSVSGMQPEVEGMRSFPGLQLHCHNYRHTHPFAGMRVLVVGASFSGSTTLAVQTKRVSSVAC